MGILIENFLFIEKETTQQNEVTKVLNNIQFISDNLLQEFHTVGDLACNDQEIVPLKKFKNSIIFKRCIVINDQLKEENFYYCLKKGKLYRKIKSKKAHLLLEGVEKFSILPLMEKKEMVGIRLWLVLYTKEKIWHQTKYYYLNQYIAASPYHNYYSWPIDIAFRHPNKIISEK